MNAESPQLPVESILARRTVARSVYVAPILIVLFGLTGGWEGAWSAALGVAVVVANFLVAGAILSISARISLQAYHAAALIGFVLRLGLFVALVLVVSATIPVDRMAFGITAVVVYMALLVLEALAVSKGKERELNWTG
ncbi:MAG: ATP synthase subunit I [Acidimicrobiia bacterium]